MANKTGMTSDRRLYLDKDNNVVEHDNPAKASLLVAQGGILSNEDAAKYGISTGEDGKLTFGTQGEVAAVDSETAEEETESASDDLESLSVADLKERAKDMGLTGYSNLNKADLIAAIEAGPEVEE
jgi:hypothetical protein